MARKLSDIQPDEVSLVRSGANRRRFLLAKSDDGHEVSETLADVLAAPATGEAALLAQVRKAGGDETVEEAAAAYARAEAALADAFGAEVWKAMRKPADDNADDDEDALDESADEDTEDDSDDDMVEKRQFTAEQRKKLADSGAAMPNGSYPIENRQDLENAIHAIGRGNAPHADIKAHIINRARALGATASLPDSWNVTKEDSMTETAHAVPVKKEDGTWDLSAVPEDNRAALEAVLKAHEDEVAELRKAKDESESKADEAIRIAKAEQDLRETREYIAKSASLDGLAKDDDEFGPVLREIAKAEQAEHLPEGTFAKLETVLKAANEQVSTGALYAELGRAGHGTSNGESKLDAAAAEIRKSEPKLSEAQSIAKALENDPTLYDEYRKAVA